MAVSQNIQGVTDLALTPGGDLVLNYEGGLAMVSDIQLDYQDMAYRVQTNNPDFTLYNIGANLEDLDGMPNTPTTGQLGINSITSALTYDGRFMASSIEVDATPINFTSIQFDVSLNNQQVFTTVPLFTVVQNVNG